MKSRFPLRALVCAVAALLPAALPLRAAPNGTLQGKPWPRHPIDDEGRGADGTKLGDLNRDGRPDIVSGWEEDGTSRVYLHPGDAAVRQRWPRVIVGRTPAAEDAVFADLDGDGRLDVVSATEGDSRRILVHWAPAPERLLAAEAWRQESFPMLAGMTGWMFAEPLQVDGRHGTDLVVGGKRMGNQPASILGWLEAPARGRDVAAWVWHPLREMGWTMTIHLEDMDGDGDTDILFSDRRDRARGVHWLENPGAAKARDRAAWTQHPVGATAASAEQVMLIDVGDIDGDGLRDIVAPVETGRTDPREPNRHSELRWFRRLDASGRRWAEHRIAVPENTGNVKHAAIGDLDGDGRSDLVVSCENATGDRVGVYWLRGDDVRAERWAAFDISGAPGIKFDLVRLVDLDGDGDLDVLTNEEQENRNGLGVFWYENTRPAAPPVRRR